MKNKKEKNKLKPENRNQQGITLIALVITIIVLLILAGVSIAMLTGQNGILTQANNSKIEQSHGAVKEAISLAYNEWQIEINTGSRTKLASTETVIINGEEEKAKAGTEETFLQFLESKGYIKEGTTDILNVEKLTGSKQALGNGTDTDIYKIEEQDGEYVVNYIDEKNGKRQIWNVKNETEQDQSNIYTYTEDGYITGIKPEYFKNNTYGEVWKIASTGNKIAFRPPQYYLIDELNGTLRIPSKIGDTKIIGIGEGAFEFIANLQYVNISEGIISIAESAFYNCYALQTVELPNSLKDIGYIAFSDCHLKSIIIPQGITAIGDYAFENINNLCIFYGSGECDISGYPWGAENAMLLPESKYSEYTSFVEKFIAENIEGKEAEDLEKMILKYELYPGTFTEYLEYKNTSKDELVQRYGMTYEEVLKMFVRNCINLEYYVATNGINDKNETELKQMIINIYNEVSGNTVSEFNEIFNNFPITEEEYNSMWSAGGRYSSEKECLKYMLLNLMMYS